MITSLTSYFRRVAKAIFSRVPIKTLAEDAKYQAQRDLLEADFNAEHWMCQADMLRGRIARLDEQLVDASGAKSALVINVKDVL